jgi:hypothetical protein
MRKRRLDSSIETEISTLPNGERYLQALHKGIYEDAKEIELKITRVDLTVKESDQISPPAEISPQIAIASLTSLNKPEEARKKGCNGGLIQTTDHILDDPTTPPLFKDLYENRRNFIKYLSNLPQTKILISSMLNNVPKHNGEYFKKGLVKLAYGSAIQLSDDEMKTETLTHELKNDSLIDINPELSKNLRGIDPKAFWVVSKAPMELADSISTETYDPSITLAWSIIFGAGRFYYNYLEERKAGQSSISERDIPKEDLKRMVLSSGEYISNFENGNRPLRFKSFELFVKAFYPFLKKYSLATTYSTLVQKFNEKEDKSISSVSDLTTLLC